jgi:hypothetical protein
MKMTSMTMNSHPNQNPSAHAMSSGGPVKKAVFVLTEKMTPDGTRTFWTRVGAAFDNKDGSVTVRLDALPLSGTLQIREDDRENRRDRASQAPF